VERAATTASELLNVKKYPKVVNAVMKRRDEISTTHKVEMNKHVQELARLRDKALNEKSYSAAVNAERLRGQAAGLYIDRKEIRTGSIDSMSREEVLTKLKEIGLDGKIIQDEKGVVIEVQEEKSNSKGLKDITPIQAEDSKGQDGV
tara:strand:- start:685 stop:1125 length:441 start_codon:yes stop_codon:yes gene_type:complete